MRAEKRYRRAIRPLPADHQAPNSAAPSSHDDPGRPATRWGEGDFHVHKAEVVRLFERDYLLALLTDCGGNVSAAARKSGLARNHLRDLHKRHAIDPDRFRS